MSEVEETKEVQNGFAKAAHVIGIISLVLCWVPVINNAIAILSIVGLILGGIGIIKVSKSNGKTGYVIASLAFNFAAFILVVLTQYIYLGLYYDYIDGPQAIPADTPVIELSLGQTARLENGLIITVDDVKHGITDDYYDGELMSVSVTIENASSENRSFGPSDWEAINDNGVISHTVFVSNASNRLGGGTFLPGGKVSGDIFIKNNSSKLAYVTGHDNRIAATWKLD